MKFDKFSLLRRSSIGQDFETSENFIKCQDKYSDIHYNFSPETFLCYNDLSQKYLIYNASPTFKFDFSLPPPPESKSFQNSKYNNIDIIHEKASKNLYFSFKKFEKDLFKMFSVILQTRCFSKSSRNYITSLLDYYLKCLKSKKLPSNFFTVKLQDIANIASQETNFKLQCSNWPVIPKSFRHYDNIESYMPIDDKQDVKTELTAYKKPTKCPEGCACWRYETLGEFSYEQSTWISSCPNRAQMIECDESSHKGFCKNMGIGLKQRKKLGDDVEETLSWGIDIYTRKNIFMVLSEDKEAIDAKFNFIQNKLMKAINLQVNNLRNSKNKYKKIYTYLIERTRLQYEDCM